MGVSKNFVVKNGIEVATDLIYSDVPTVNVGIGTTLPTRKLDINGNFNVVEDTRIGGITTVEGKFGVGVGDTALCVDTGTERIGINSTTPGYNLDVNGDVGISSHLKVGGISTAPILHVTGLTSSVHMNVTGITTIADVRIEAGFSTVTYSEAQYLNVTGVGTFAQLDATNIKVSGIATINQMNTTGVATFVSDVELQSNLTIASDQNLYVGGTGAGGTGGLQIYHVASNETTYITETGSGTLNIGGDASINIANADLNEYKARFFTNGSVELYYDNVKKFETTSRGVDVTGNLDTDTMVVSGLSTLTTVDINGGDVDIDTLDVVGVATFADVRIEAGFTTVTYSEAQYLNVTGVGTIATVDINAGDVDINTLEVSGVSTFSGNVECQSNLTIADDNKIYVGGTGGLEIYHTSNTTYITETGSGALNIGGDASVNIANAALNEYKARFFTDGAVELYYDNVKKFETTTDGINVTGLTDTDTLNVSGNATITGVATVGIITDVTTMSVNGPLYANQLIGDGSLITGLDTSGNFQGKTVVCQNVFSTGPGIGTFGSIVINNPAGRITATEFYGDGSNLTNTGSTLGTGSGVERLVTTSLTTGMMTSSSTDPNLVYDFANDRLGIGTTNPGTRFHVEETGTSGTNTFIQRITTASGGSFNIRCSDLASAAPDWEFLTGNSEDIVFSPSSSESARLDSSGRMLVGTSSARTDLIAGTRGGRVQIEEASSTVANAIDNSSLCLTMGHSGPTGSANIFFTRTKSDSLGGVTSVSNDNVLGGLYFQGTDGTDAVSAALIKAEVDGTPGPNDMPGRIVLATTADGASSPTERLRIDKTGDIYVYGGDILPSTDNTGNVGNSSLTWSNGRFTNFTVDSTLNVRGAIDLADNDVLRFGSSDDAEFFCNGSHLYLDLNSGIGNFYIRDGGTNRFEFDDNGDFTSTGTVTSNVKFVSDELRNRTGSQLVLNAGESYISATGQTGEFVYINAESGLQVNSSPDNWESGWAERKTATICDANGNSSFPGNVTATGTVTATTFSGSGASLTSIPNSALNNSTISGVSLGSNLATLTRGSYLTGSNYNGSTARTWAVDAASSNTANKVVARDSSGNFSAGTITATLSGTATNSTNVRIDTESSTTTHYVTFADGGGGSNRRLKVDGGMSYNPSSNTLTVANLSGNASTATNANNAGLLDGYDSSQSATGNTVAVRENDGDLVMRYAMTSYVNMSHSASTRTADTVFYSSTDAFVRKNNASGFRSSLNVPTRTGGDASGTWGINITGNADTVDNLHASSFLRSDNDDSASGTITFNGRVNIRGHIDLSDGENLDFGSSDDVRIYYYSNDWLYWNFRTGNGIVFQDDGSSKIVLEDSGVFRPETNNTGTIGSSSRYWENGYFQDFNVSSILNVRGALDLADSDILRLGSSDDVEFFFNGSHFYTDLNTGGGSNFSWYIRQNTTTRFTFESNGDFTATGDIETSSDVRLKDNIETLEGSLDKIKQIRGVEYDRIDRRMNGESKYHQLGVIAQEIEKVYPDMVSEDVDGMKTVSYQQLIPVLVEAVKELSTKVEDLESKLDK